MLRPRCLSLSGENEIGHGRGRAVLQRMALPQHRRARAHPNPNRDSRMVAKFRVDSNGGRSHDTDCVSVRSEHAAYVFCVVWCVYLNSTAKLWWATSTHCRSLRIRDFGPSQQPFCGLCCRSWYRAQRAAAPVMLMLDGVWECIIIYGGIFASATCRSIEGAARAVRAVT